LQRWGKNDISKRIKQSIILYDEIIIETGTYRYSGAERFVLDSFDPWSEQNSKEGVLKQLEEIEKRTEESYITVFDGKTHAEKYRYKVDKKDEYVVDYRTVEVISDIESGSYGKEVDFLKYAVINRKNNHRDIINQNTGKDLENKEFADTAIKIYGQMPLVKLLYNLNDSLAISHFFKIPVAVDEMHAPLLKCKTKCQVGLEFPILDRLAEIGIPDFSDFSLDKLLELRKDKAIASFRNLISKISSKLQSKSDVNIETLFTQELFEQIEEMAPSKKKITLDAALGALSFVPCPLVSVATTVTDIGKELKEYRDFATNWLSFVLRARE
jgi:hypothetical protein